ncbi:acyltransferase family protein [Clostridium aciditolerans]|uniref:DUF5009 domain-containing protein n=1 Tax=Clostridium aciditolerans TaxID=339861 RepID=A0A934HNT9_9CLOT|nr:DUF5009 domain-containing protein [Clostridium aciditolerans]MBI6871565.1 DUF5009 domain-containing protein [Clostridium aciditolerans]
MGSRIKAIDVLRGFAVAIMVLCNNPGNGDRNYVQLRHVPWNGLTFADFGFPFFILITGMAIPIVMNRRLSESNNKKYVILKVFIRSFILIMLGIFLNGFPLFDFTSIRIPGVLQRIGIVYLFSSLIYISIKCNTKKDSQVVGSLIAVSLIIIIGYYLILKPYGFEMEGNLVQRIDSRFLSGHLALKTWDPEGILSTLASISSGTLGCTIGYFLVCKSKSDYNRVLNIGILGTISLVGAFLFNKVFPFNKAIWSSSFILVTAGAAALSIAILYLICDIYKKEGLFRPFTALGSSPIFVYLVSELIRKTLWRVPIYDSQFKEVLGFCPWITFKFITPWAGEWLDSLYFSILYVILWMWIMNRMYSKNKYIKL